MSESKPTNPDDSKMTDCRKSCVACLYPERDPPMYRRNTLIIVGISFVIIFLFMIAMIVCFGVSLSNANSSEDDLEYWKRVLKAEQLVLAEINANIAKCHAECGLIHCNDCCPACEWDAAPAPPTATDLWRFPTFPNSVCQDYAYASITVPPPPNAVCRYGNLRFTYCGFRNDYSLSLLEAPHSLSTNGTIVASRIQSTIPDGTFCVSMLGSFSPAGTTTFILRGDQTGFSISFDTQVIVSSGGSLCNPVVCSSNI